MIGGWGTPTNMAIKSDVPFMAEKEYRYIQDLINGRKYQAALEWGAGSSTIWFPNNTNIEWWISVEHNPVYVEYLRNKVSTKVELCLAESKKKYINVEGSFDFILIDGLYRDECLAKSFDLLEPGGSILLHDSGRKTYYNWYKKYPHTIIFNGEGWLGEGEWGSSQDWDHRGLCAFTK
jgi:predicted O-methyltransferase YrrM